MSDYKEDLIETNLSQAVKYIKHDDYRATFKTKEGTITFKQHLKHIYALTKRDDCWAFINRQGHVKASSRDLKLLLKSAVNMYRVKLFHQNKEKPKLVITTQEEV